MNKKTSICIAMFVFLFCLTILSAIIFSIYVFKDVSFSSESVQNLMRSEYIRTRLKSNEFDTTDFGDGKALVCREDEYETLIYHYNGQLMELFSEVGLDLEPEEGEVLFPADRFEIVSEDNLISIQVDDEQVVFLKR